MLLAVTQGVFDHLPFACITAAEEAVRHAVAVQLPEFGRGVEAGAVLRDEDRERAVNR